MVFFFFLIECRKTQPHKMAADSHSPAAASLLAMEIEGNAILNWAGWRRRRRWGEGEKEGGEEGKRH